MSTRGRRWSIEDRYGNTIYITKERWAHIIAPTNHPEMAGYEEHLKQTLRQGKRQQESLNPHKYRYSHSFDDLCESNTHMVVIVLFRFATDETGLPVPNNYIVTAFQKEIG